MNRGELNVQTLLRTRVQLFRRLQQIERRMMRLTRGSFGRKAPLKNRFARLSRAR